MTSTPTDWAHTGQIAVVGIITDLLCAERISKKVTRENGKHALSAREMFQKLNTMIGFQMTIILKNWRSSRMRFCVLRANLSPKSLKTLVCGHHPKIKQTIFVRSVLDSE